MSIINQIYSVFFTEANLNHLKSALIDLIPNFYTLKVSNLNFETATILQSNLL